MMPDGLNSAPPGFLLPEELFYPPYMADFFFTGSYRSVEKPRRLMVLFSAYRRIAANAETMRKNTVKFTENAISFL